MTDPRFTIPAEADQFGAALDDLIDRARDGGISDKAIAVVLEDRAWRERRRVEAAE